MKSVDIVGQRFGRLRVLEMLRGAGNTKVRCQCDCGKQTTALAYNVKNGNTSSCGCASKEAAAERGRQMAPEMGRANKTHGLTKTPAYVCWQEAKKRCHLPTHTRYPEYGARGVAVCDRWRHSFENFIADMGECARGMTLERIDNSKGYEPGNCVWATREQQAQNRPSWNKATPEIVREIRRRSDAGETGRALALEFGMCESTASQIIRRKSWKNVT